MTQGSNNADGNGAIPGGPPLTGATAPPAQRVLIVGAGPSGLALAGELALAGIPCRVLERRAWRTKESRAFALHARTMEMLALRGDAEEAVAYSRAVARLRLSTSSGAIDFRGLESRFAQLTVLPQSVTEDILEARARRLGVEIIRQAEVVDLAQDASGVTLQVRGEAGQWEERGSYVVGCDGAHSVVRQLAGIGFEGGTFSFAAILADVRLRRAPAAEFMVFPGRGSVLVSVPYTDGWYRVACLDRERPWTGEPVTLDELAESLRRATGRELDPYAPRWMARFRVHERLATHYRHGRVLLAGDAAHLHSPMGGQGLNIGIQDAFNLGWKLAAVLGGWAGEDLLDSYETERRPVAAKVIRATGRATAVMTSTSPLVRAARSLVFRRLLPLGPVQRRVRGAVSGISLAYQAGQQDGALGGRRLPDLRLSLTDGRTARLSELTRDGRFLLLDLGPRGACASAVGGWADRVRPIIADIAEPAATRDGGLRGAVAVLVRPDGYAAWSTAAADPAVRAAECRGALNRWCGPEQRPAINGLPVFGADASADLTEDPLTGVVGDEQLDTVLRALDEALLDSPRLNAVSSESAVPRVETRMTGTGGGFDAAS